MQPGTTSSEAARLAPSRFPGPWAAPLARPWVACEACRVWICCVVVGRGKKKRGLGRWWRRRGRGWSIVRVVGFLIVMVLLVVFLREVGKRFFFLEIAVEIGFGGFWGLRLIGSCNSNLLLPQIFDQLGRCIFDVERPRRGLINGSAVCSSSNMEGK